MKRITITKKRVSARQIIKAQIGETDGKINISKINGCDVHWNYRTHYVNGQWSSMDRPVCTAEDADCITIYNAGDLGDEKKGGFGDIIAELEL